LCTSMKAWAVTPANDTVPLIDIPEWDFHWQGGYAFRKPVFLPGGSWLYGEATYDNTTANLDNPNHNNPQLVTLGESTTDEMMLFYFTYTYGFPNDTNIVIDMSPHAEHYLDCEVTSHVGIGEDIAPEVIRIAPSPAHGFFRVSLAEDDLELRLMDLRGRQVQRTRIVRGDNVVDASALQPGAYIAVVQRRSGEVLHRRTIVLE
ncbi:MAG TPA: hypothetical protein PK760_05090, partial [Flavobacteriales bacterium]|nr:hypothetical protein [Flavobacteriales bacterium]